MLGLLVRLLSTVPAEEQTGGIADEAAPHLQLIYQDDSCRHCLEAQRERVLPANASENLFPMRVVSMKGMLLGKTIVQMPLSLHEQGHAHP